MLDDYKYSPGRMVVYDHPEPKQPRQSYGQFGHTKTVGEVKRVEISPSPEPHWVYTLRNVRNGETARVSESRILFATDFGKRHREKPGDRPDRAQLTELIVRVLNVPARESLLRSALRDMLSSEKHDNKKTAEGSDPPYEVGDYIRIRGDLRAETNHIHNHYARILSVEPSDIAGIENPSPKHGQPTMFRTRRKYKVYTSEDVTADIYDVEVKVFYTAKGRRLILNWRAATLLAETFQDDAPYNLEFEYLVDHVFTRDELVHQRKSQLVHLLAGLLYVKGKMGWKDFQHKSQIFSGTPKSHLIDKILEMSRFDSRHNRDMTDEEITSSRKQAFKLRRLLKNR